MRWLKIITAGGVFIVALLATMWWWLLHTDAGARFVWDRAASALDGGLAAGGISGNLGQGITLTNFHFANANVEADIERLRLAADVDLIPLSLRLSGVQLASPSIAVMAETADSDPPPVAELAQVIRGLELPVWLFVDDLAVSNLTLALPDESIEVTRASLSGRWRERIEIDDLTFATPIDTGRLSGSMDLRSPFEFTADVELTSRRPVVGADDMLRARLNVAGRPDKYDIEASGNAALTGYRPIDLSMTGRGSTESLEIGSFTIDGDDLAATGDASLNIKPSLRVAAEVVLERANVQAMLSGWPREHPLAGSLNLQYSRGSLKIDRTRLSVEGTNSSVDLRVDIDIAGEKLAGAMNWENLQWPVVTTEPDISSSSGNIVLTGSPDAWRINGPVKLAAAGIDEGRFDIDAAGDRERARVVINDAAVLGGRLSGLASASWVGQRPWSAEIDLQGIRTGSLLPDWPMVASGHVDASGRAGDEWLKADLRNIRGTLRRRDFTANGGIELSGRNLIAKKLELRHADSRLVVDGDLYASRGLTFTADISNIGDLLKDASGGVKASGTVSLNDASTFLRLNASSAMLKLGDLQLVGLEITEITDESGAGSAVALRLRAEEFVTGGKALQIPELILNASKDRQRLRFSGRYDEIDLEVAMQGRADDWKAPSEWRGTIEDVVIDAGEQARVALQAPAELAISKNGVSLAGLCMTEPASGSLCGNLEWSVGRRFDLSTDIADVPVELVNRFRDTGFRFDQRVTGRVRWEQLAGRPASGAADISISAGSVLNRDRPRLVANTDVGTLAFDIKDGRLLFGTVKLPMPGTGSIDGEFSVLDVTNIQTSPVSGRLQFMLQNIELFAVVSPLIDSAKGRLEGEIDLSGTVESPLLSGRVDLQGASVAYVPLGLALDDIQLTSDLQENGGIDVRGSFRAGDGRGEIRTSTGFSGAGEKGIQVKLRGDGLTVINVPDVMAVADVDIDVGFIDDTLTLGGKVLIPRASVRPQNLMTNKETVSDDVVIVAGSLPDTEQQAATSTLAIMGSLEVALGDDVSVELDIAKATVSGKAKYTWKGDPIPVANGRYAIAGDINAFGQVLTVVEGGIRFPNVPATNPTLRIRAEREIFGNSQVKTAGVLVTGTIARPRLEAYTYPATTGERALTLLVTGSDFSYEQGVGAVDFGTYIAPKLFVSYGVGLFGRDNVISARYDLSRGFGIKATSGQQESGIDFTYSFER